MTLFPDILFCPISSSEPLLFDDQKDAEQLDIW